MHQSIKPLIINMIQGEASNRQHAIAGGRNSEVQGRQHLLKRSSQLETFIRIGQWQQKRKAIGLDVGDKILGSAMAGDGTGNLLQKPISLFVATTSIDGAEVVEVEE